MSGNGNRVADNHLAGCSGGGLVIGSGADNEVIDNMVVGLGTGAGLGDPDGILVQAFTAGTLLQGNHVEGHDDDGIDVRAAGRGFWTTGPTTTSTSASTRWPA